MKRFEYFVQYNIPSEQLPLRLNDLGRLGWELLQIFSGGTGYTLNVAMKRELPSSADPSSFE